MAKTPAQKRDEKYLLLANKYKSARANLDAVIAEISAAGLILNATNGIYIYWADKRGGLHNVLYEPIKDGRK